MSRPIIEVEGLLKQVRDAWAEMLRRPDGSLAQPRAPIAPTEAREDSVARS